MIFPLTINPITAIKYAVVAVVVAIAIYIYMHIQGLNGVITELNTELTITKQTLMIERINVETMASAIKQQNEAIDRITVDANKANAVANRKIGTIDAERRALVAKLDIVPTTVVKYIECNSTNTNDANTALNILLGDMNDR